MADGTSEHVRVTDAHRALVAKADAFDRTVRARRASDMQCRAGCSACCGDQLTVCDVEAALLREALDALAPVAIDRLRVRLEALAPTSPCVMLEADGRCSVYEARPLVCRTQGLPLKYAAALVPVAAILARARGTDDALTWCPLNFTERAPATEDVLDAERLDTMLALSNRGAGGDAERRTALSELAREAVTRAR